MPETVPLVDVLKRLLDEDIPEQRKLASAANLIGRRFREIPTGMAEVTTSIATDGSQILIFQGLSDARPDARPKEPPTLRRVK